MIVSLGLFDAHPRFLRHTGIGPRRPRSQMPAVASPDLAVENPYWQHFCGEVYLQTELPMDPSSLTRWRKRIGEEGVETLLAATIEAARKGGVARASSAERVIVDSTVMPKAIAHPADSRPLERSRAHLVKAAAADNGIVLRQNYNLYALHAPEVECISKCGARSPYEFGVKVSIATKAWWSACAACQATPTTATP